MKFIYLIAILILLYPAASLTGQINAEEEKIEDPAILLGIDYGYNLVGADFKDRFGNNLQFGGKLSYLFKNSGIHLGLSASYFFGDTVKQDVLAHLRDINGYIIGINGDYGKVKMKQRGFDIGLFIAKVFPLRKVNKRSGIRVDLGVSGIQHWIRLQDEYNTIAQFDEPYEKGYDRLSNGVALNEFIGYQYLSKNNRVNFYAGLSFTQAWTKNRRDYDFASMSELDENRLELFSGIKVGWVLPFYFEAQPDELYY